MEEVVGSIPTRSTNSLNKLDRPSARRHGIGVVVCILTRRFVCNTAMRDEKLPRLPIPHPESWEQSRRTSDGVYCEATKHSMPRHEAVIASPQE
jgi:hypothetical protein